MYLYQTEFKNCQILIGEDVFFNDVMHNVTICCAMQRLPKFEYSETFRLALCGCYF